MANRQSKEVPDHSQSVSSGREPVTAGSLYVVATPIGNLEDCSPRAQKTLRDVALVLAEDTRVTRKLLSHLGIAAQLQSLHQHNEAARSQAVVDRILAGESIALVSDAGTPLVSDPGFVLVRDAARAGVVIRAVPGPSSVSAALSVAGLPVDRFTFEGFLPARPAARRAVLTALAQEPRTQVFFETGPRLAASLADAAKAFGADRPAAIARELTKRHETVLRGTLGELQAQVQADPDQRRGEMVLMVAGAPPVAEDLVEGRRVLQILAAELPRSQAARLASAISGVPRRALYESTTEEE